MSKRVFLKNGNMAWDEFQVEDITVTGTSTVKTNETLEGDTTIGNEASDNLDINATLNTSFALGGNDLTNGGRLEADQYDVINAGAGSNPSLASNDDGQTLTLTGEFHLNDGQRIHWGTNEDYSLKFDSTEGANGAFVFTDEINTDVEAKFIVGGGIEFAGQTIDTKLNPGEDIFKLRASDTNDELQFELDSSNQFLVKTRDDTAGTETTHMTFEPLAPQLTFNTAPDFAGGLVVNEGGDGSTAIRVESSSNDSLLRSFPGTDQVAFGEAAAASDWGRINAAPRDSGTGSDLDMTATFGDGMDSAVLNRADPGNVSNVRIGNIELTAGTSTTVTDAATLYVPGPLQAGTNVTIANSYLCLMEDGSGNLVASIDDAATLTLANQGAGSDPTLQSNDSNQVLTLTGRLGVGESAALAPLHITNDQAALTEARLDNSDASGSMAYTLYDGSSERAAFHYDTASALLDIRTNFSSGQIAFSTNTDVEALRIDASQNVDVVAGSLNMASSNNIQDAGTDAIQFDGSTNITLPGNLTVTGTSTLSSALTLDDAGGTNASYTESGIDRSSGSAETFNVQNSGAGAMTLQQDGTAVVLETRSLTGGTAIQAIGDLSQDRTVNFDTAASLTITGSYDLSGGGLVLPTASAPTPTTEGDAIWDTDDDVLRIGDGAATVTFNPLSVTGTPADNEVAVWTASDDLEGASSLTWDGTTLTVSGFADLNGTAYQVNNITGDGAATTIADNDRYVFVDSSSNTETINLPASPSTGQTHTIRRDGSNNVTVDGNGNNVQEGTSSSTSFTLDTDAQRVEFAFDGILWKAVD